MLDKGCESCIMIGKEYEMYEISERISGNILGHEIYSHSTKKWTNQVKEYSEYFDNYIWVESPGKIESKEELIRTKLLYNDGRIDYV